MNIGHVVGHAVALLKQKVNESRHTRSSQWPAIERRFLRANPTCAACGGRERLNVHHVIPFHRRPDLELVETNLITLCMGVSLHCHLMIGHGDNFKAYVPRLRLLCSMIEKGDMSWHSAVELARRSRLWA